jgi:hypothetical protein
MSQNYQIGNEFGVTFKERLEWRLSKIQSALGTGGSSPAVEALLTDLLAVMQLIQGQTDGIELTSENISLNADEISLNTDQVEAELQSLFVALTNTNITLDGNVTQLLAQIRNFTQDIDGQMYATNASIDGLEGLLVAIDGHIVALQAQVGNTAGIEARLIEVRDQLIAVAGSTDGIEAGIAGLDTKAIAAHLSLSVIEAQLGGFQPLIDGLEGLLTSLLASSTAIETQLSNIESVSGDTNTLLATQGADVALIRTATANLLTVVTALESGTATDLTAIQAVLADELIKLNQIYGTATNSEALLTAIDAHIVALQTQIGNTATVEARLTEVRDQLIASVATTDGLEGLSTAGNAKLDTLVSQTDGLEAALASQLAATAAGNLTVGGVLTATQAIQIQTDQVEALLTAINGQIAALQIQVGNAAALEALLTDVRDQALLQTGWLSNIGQELGNSTGNGGVISSLINSKLVNLVSLNQQIYDQIKPLEFKTSNLYDANSHQIGSPLFISADPLCRKKSILNDTGESGGSGNTPLAGQAWIFGSYRNDNVNQDDFDFVVDPGDTHVCDLSASDVWLVCINQSSPSGRFLVMEYQ